VIGRASCWSICSLADVEKETFTGTLNLGQQSAM